MASILPPISIKTLLLCIAWYLVLSFTSQVTKIILVKMTYPFFLTQAQFLMGAILSYSLIQALRIFPQINSVFPPKTLPTDSTVALFNRHIFVNILPLGILQFAGKYFSMSATLVIPVATVASMKALCPMLLVLGYRIIYRVNIPVVTYLLLTPLLAGVIMMILVDSDHVLTSLSVFTFEGRNIKGLLYSAFSAIFMASQQMYGKELITWDSQAQSNPASLVLNTDPSRPASPAVFGQSPSKLGGGSVSHLPLSVSDLKLNEFNNKRYLNQVYKGRLFTNPLARFSPSTLVSKPDKFTVIFYISVIGFAFSFSGFLANEALNLLHSIGDPSHFKGSLSGGGDLLLVFILIILDSLSHFCQSALSFILLGSMHALSYSIASMMKRIVIIFIGLLFAVETSSRDTAEKWFGKISTPQLQGLVLITFGLYCYDRWGSRSVKKNRQ